MKMKLLLFTSLLIASVGVSILASFDAHAVGESYKWINATTIEGSGGSYGQTTGVVKTGDQGPSRPIPVGKVQFTRDGNSAIFKAPTDLYYKSTGSIDTSKCDLQLTITLTGVDKGTLATNSPGSRSCTNTKLTQAVTVADTDKGPDPANLGIAGPTVADPPAGTTNTGSSCKVEAVGWIVCPVLNLMAKLVDGAYALVSSLLTVQPIVSTRSTDGSKSIFDTWSIMRNFANVAFVIAFMVIIFSQLTSFGMNNYGIKKMLPRLIVAAILVNTSFWICAIAVDISNILGTSFRGLFDGIPINGERLLFEGDDGQTGNGFAGITGLVLASTIVGIGVLYATLSALVPALLAALVAIATVFIVLTIRQALIILLIVVSPLAFVAYLLPNTESLFKKWMGLFKTLLLMYPIIAIIFGASALASKIVMGSATGDYKVAVQIMGALITIIPLALTPVIMKTAGGLLNRIGGVVNNPNKGPIDALRKKAEAHRDFRQGLARGRRIDRANRFRKGEMLNGKVGKKLFGDASTPAGRADRAAASRIFGGAYEANQRDRSRKDRLGAYESDAEQTYNESLEGQKYATAAIQAKNRAGTASTNIAALAAETTEKADLAAAQSAKDRQSIAQNNNDAYAESNRELGTRLEQALSKSTLEQMQKLGEVEVENVKANRAALTGDAMLTGDALRASELEKRVADGQLDSAKRIQTQDFHKAVANKDDTSLATRVGGVDPHGRSRAVANAMDAESRTSNEAIGAEKKTMRDMQISDLELEANNVNNSLERRLAASSMKNVVSNPKDLLTTMDTLSDNLRAANASGNKQEITVAKEMQQQFMEDAGGKLSMVISGPTKGQLASGKYTGSVAEDIIDTFNSGGLSGEKLAGMHYGELETVNKALGDYKLALDRTQAANLKVSINQFNSAAASLGKGPTENIAKPMNDIASRLP